MGMAEMNENAEKVNFHAEENREETVFDEVETEETKKKEKKWKISTKVLQKKVL